MRGARPAKYFGLGGAKGTRYLLLHVLHPVEIGMVGEVGKDEIIMNTDPNLLLRLQGC